MTNPSSSRFREWVRELQARQDLNHILSVADDVMTASIGFRDETTGESFLLKIKDIKSGRDEDYEALGISRMDFASDVNRRLLICGR